MELPPSSHDSANTPFNLTLHNPSTYTLTPKLHHRWQPLVMVANLPHVEVLLTANEGDEPVQCMFMLDSGAGGVDAMFHSRAVRELGLIQDNKHGMRTLTVCCCQLLRNILQDRETCIVRLSHMARMVRTHAQCIICKRGDVGRIVAKMLVLLNPCECK